MPENLEDGAVVEPVEGAEPVVPASPLEPGGVRFEQVYGKMKDYEAQMKQYKDLGDANELRSMREEHLRWKAAVEEYKAKQNMTPDQQTEAQRVKAIRDELIKVYPELEQVRTVEGLMKQVEELRGNFQEQNTRAVLAKASEAFTSVLKANKVDLKFQDKIEAHIADQMTDDEKRAFIGGDFSIAEKIFTNELNDGLLSGFKAKSSLPTPSVRHTPGGTPPAGATKGPSSLKEAEDVAWARIRG